MHLIYPTNKVLSRYWDTDEMCVLCKIEQETVSHLFYECHCVKLFWVDMEIYVKDLRGTCVRLDAKEIILYFDHNFGCKEIFMLSFFILFGKYHFHKCRLTKKNKHHASNNLNRNLNITWGLWKGLKTKSNLDAVSMQRLKHLLIFQFDTVTFQSIFFFSPETSPGVWYCWWPPWSSPQLLTFWHQQPSL